MTEEPAQTQRKKERPKIQFERVIDPARGTCFEARVPNRRRWLLILSLYEAHLPGAYHPVFSARRVPFRPRKHRDDTHLEITRNLVTGEHAYSSGGRYLKATAKPWEIIQNEPENRAGLRNYVLKHWKDFDLHPDHEEHRKNWDDLRAKLAQSFGIPLT